METKEEKWFETKEFKKYLEELKELGKKGFKIGDGVMISRIGLNSISHTYKSLGKDLKEINFPFIGKLKVVDITEPDENNPTGLIEVKCEEKDITFTFRHDDAKETYLELIYREGIELPKNIEVIK